MVIESCVVFLADAVLTWRVWMVYNRRLLVVGPSIALWLGTIGCTIYLLVLELSSMSPSLGPDEPLLVSATQWLMAAEILTLVQNTLATLLIAFRLWRMDRKVSRYREGSLITVVWVVIESGALFSALWITEIAPNAAGYEPGILAVSQLATPVVGIAFSLLIVRVGLGLTNDFPVQKGATPISSSITSVAVPREVDLEEGPSWESEGWNR
ncbi:hypothetical protein CALCODRAFT_559235 [Calocera cornea HHB12733]|uniref:Uncharacterized protein n=1 Tax=Calocera cornea HHB12733 TaxID=1353952 RepID=A0A165C203_9BASI|nr:hypothetical protein CALCODRAFT_559235 [Calocera cornea HHB12733]